MAARRVIPLLNRVLVQRAEPIKESKGGIVIPETSQEKMMEAMIVAVGPGPRNPETGKNMAPCVSPGDRVLIPKYGGTKVDLGDGKEYQLYRESEILAKIQV
ncbi:10 kDa heat shock protein, mitochondrial-like [Uranotaenia lowii]|uniref:10 kDa heat shock protein, mitochondrial-like n=1 Tax=Uranotaenia lowii TaxID=190385 RepID=UPI002479189F|nr:10 kDa heat shock protein, mitochondrial-like [Uranotaenia lowii]